MRLSLRLLTVCALALALTVGTAAWSASALAAGSTSSSPKASEDRTAKRFAKAKKEIRKGDYEDAIELLEKVVRKQPNNADAYNLLGFSHRKLKKFDTAYKYYTRALKIDPNHKGALEYLGELYVDTGDLKSAEAVLARLAAVCPSGCEEKDDLTERIVAYKKRSGG
ncbi:MAG: tetratricopeptide repeat protein [Kiloniellales bacterium]